MQIRISNWRSRPMCLMNWQDLIQARDSENLPDKNFSFLKYIWKERLNNNKWQQPTNKIVVGFKLTHTQSCMQNLTSAETSLSFYLLWKLRNLMPKAKTKKKRREKPIWAAATAPRQSWSKPKCSLGSPSLEYQLLQVPQSELSCLPPEKLQGRRVSKPLDKPSNTTSTILEFAAEVKPFDFSLLSMQSTWNHIMIMNGAWRTRWEF